MKSQFQPLMPPRLASFANANRIIERDGLADRNKEASISAGNINEKKFGFRHRLPAPLTANDVPKFEEHSPLAIVFTEVPEQILNRHLQDFDGRPGGDDEQVTGRRDLNQAKPCDLHQGTTRPHHDERLSGRDLNQFDRFQRTFAFARHSFDTLHDGPTAVVIHSVQLLEYPLGQRHRDRPPGLTEFRRPSSGSLLCS